MATLAGNHWIWSKFRLISGAAHREFHKRQGNPNVDSPRQYAAILLVLFLASVIRLRSFAFLRAFEP
jgi:hypothetical protein